MFARSSARLAAPLAFALSLLSASLRDARADQPTLAGSWSAGPLVENVTVTSWVDECGPKPKSSSSAGGGFKITVSGDELVFSGGKSFRTDQCWDMGLARRVSHSATPAIRWWKTRCESPPGDPRTAAITTVVRAVDDDTIVLSETARYSSTLASGTCAANVERSRTFKIVSREGAPAPTPSVTATATATAAPTPTVTAKPPPAPAVDCSSPGELATLEVKPRKKRVRPGEQFDFKARLLDSKGCEVAGKPSFRLSPDSSSITTIAVDNTGHVKVSADADPVLAGIVVEAAGKSAKVELEVMSDQAYADLLAAGGGDAGADESAVAIVVSSGGGGAAKVVDPGKPEEGRRRFAYIAIAGGFVTLLALGAIVLWRRGNAKVEHEKARREAEREAARAKRDAEKRAATPPPAGSRQCPTCKTILPPHAQFCPNDGTPLGSGPATAAAPPFQPPPPPAAARPRGRICPLCGTRYEPEAGFCSKDGASLVPLN